MRKNVSLRLTASFCNRVQRFQGGGLAGFLLGSHGSYHTGVERYPDFCSSPIPREISPRKVERWPILRMDLPAEGSSPVGGS